MATRQKLPSRWGWNTRLENRDWLRQVYRPRVEGLETRTVPAAPFNPALTILGEPGFLRSTVAADLDDDGDLDLLITDSTAAEVSWLENVAADGSVWTQHFIDGAFTNARDAVAADMDGDGDLDVVGVGAAAATNADHVAWFENRLSDGRTWTRHSIAATLDLGVRVAVEDVDGDGANDVIVTVGPYSPATEDVLWYENAAGDGTAWTPHVIDAALDGAGPLATGDIDGDTDPDVVVATGTQLAWLENTASGATWILHIIDAADGGYAVAVGDIEGDGRLDVLRSNYNTLSWWQNDTGMGTTWTEHVIDPGFNYGVGIVVGDIDGDTDDDVAALSPYSYYGTAGLYWFENVGGSGIVWNTNPVEQNSNYGVSSVIADMDGDGDADLAASRGGYAPVELSWFENAGGDGSTWTKSLIIGAFFNPNDADAADMDGDGDMDAVVVAYFSGVAWFENGAGDGETWLLHPIASAFPASKVLAADVDGDSDQDVIVLDDYYGIATLTWFENTLGDGSTWTPHLIDGSFDEIYDLAVGDIDGDGDLDVVASHYHFDYGSYSYSYGLVWFDNVNGDGTAWNPNTVVTDFYGVTDVAVADIDGDTDLDIVASAYYYSDDVVWFDNTAGDGTAWTPVVIEATANGAYAVAVGDIDGDGDADVVAALYSYYGSGVYWYENTLGDGSTWTAHSVDPTFIATDLAIGDIDGDLDDDILASNYNGVAWFDNTAGDGSTWTRVDIDASGFFFDHMVAGDVDGDGDLDAFAMRSNYYSGQPMWFENDDGSGAAWTPHVIPGGSFQFAAVIAMGDVDGDGDADVVAAAYGDSFFGWFENLGGQGLNWQFHPIDGNGYGIYDLKLADIDGDDDLDIVTTSNSYYNPTGVAWFENVDAQNDNWNFSAIDAISYGAGDVSVEDLDGDGDLDVIASHFNYSYTDDDVTWYENTLGDGSAWMPHSITLTLERTNAIVVGDIDGDDDLDIALAAGGAYYSAAAEDLVWFENAFSDGSVWNLHSIEAAYGSGPYGARDVALADVDGDTDLDLYATDFNGNVAWFANLTGDGTTWATNPVGGGVNGQLTAADLDGDGDSDLLVSDSEPIWFENTAGDGSAWTMNSLVLGTSFFNTQIAVGDMDGDGDLDAAHTMWSFLLQKIVWYRNDGFVTPPNSPPTADAGEPYVTSEGLGLVLDASQSFDPNFDPLTFRWDLNDDGDFNDAFGMTPALTWGDLTGLGLNDGPAVWNVAVEVSDGINPPVISSPVELTILNAPPSASISNSGPVPEGGTATVLLFNQADPSSADMAAQLRFSYDFGDDGTYDLGDGFTYAGSSATANPSVPAAFLADNGVIPIRVRVFDKDGDFVELTTTLVVTNVAPTATLDKSGDTVEHGNVTVGFSAQFDPSSIDTAAEFRYSYDFNDDGVFEVGDGVSYAGSDSSFSQEVPQAYLDDNPNLNVHARIFDKDGGVNDVFVTIFIANVAPDAAFAKSGDILEHGSVTVTFSGQTDPSTADTAAGFRYSYDFNNDGVFEVGNGTTYAGSVLAVSQVVPVSFVDDNPSLTVRARIFDKDGGFTEKTVTVVITNVNPTATFSSQGSLVEGQPITLAFQSQTDPSTADTLAGFLYSYDFNNDGDFTDPGEFQDVAASSQTFVFQVDGDFTVRGRITDKDGGFTDVLTNLSVPNVDIYATGHDKGGESRVRVYDSETGVEKFNFLAYDASFRGGVRVAVGDVNGDGTPDIICAPGAKGNLTLGSLNVIVYDGVTHLPMAGVLGGFRPFGDTFKKGINVAAADVNGDGLVDIIVAPGTGMVPSVRVFSGADGSMWSDLVTGFPVTGPFKKGVRVAAGDVSGDGRPDIVAHAGSGLTAQIRVFDGVTGNILPGAIGAFSPFAADVKGAVFVAVGDVNGDGRADIIAATGKTRTTVRTFNGVDGQILGETAGDAAGYKGGIRVAVSDVDGDGKADIIIGTGKARGLLPHVRALDGETFAELDQFFADPTNLFKGGVFVGGGR